MYRRIAAGASMSLLVGMSGRIYTFGAGDSGLIQYALSDMSPTLKLHHGRFSCMSVGR